MNDRNDTGRDDGERTIAEEVDDQATILKNAFNLSPETARVTAEDKVASRMRNPASDDVEEGRIAEAQKQRGKGRPMNDATSGTHSETEALEPQRKTDVYLGEPDVDDDGNAQELGETQAALEEETS